MSGADDQPKEYTVSVNTNNIYEAISQASDALYALVQQALTSHSYHEEEECPFGVFARDLLGVIERHADQITGLEVPECRCGLEEDKKWPYE